MSVATAAEFLKTYSEDEQLRSKLKNAANSGDQQRLMADAGFGDVTKEEVETVRKHITGGEMSEDELAAVSGAGASGEAVGAWLGTQVGGMIGDYAEDAINSFFED